MRLFSIFAVFAYTVAVANGQWENCNLVQEDETIAEPIRDIPIEDITRGELVGEKYTFDRVVSASIKADEFDNKYVALDFSEGVLTISLSSEYDNMEEEKPSKAEATTLLVRIDLECASAPVDRVLHRNLLVTDTNNHKPEFSSTGLTYSIPMPLPSKVPLDLFSDGILSAKDIDISNTEIKFTITPPDVFAIEESLDPTSLGKIYIARITAVKPITSLPTTEYTITATDKDGPTSSTQQIITITVDPDSSLPASPAFDGRYYEGTYTINDGGVHSLTITPITLTNVEATHVIDIELVTPAGMETHFTHAYDTGTNTITINKGADLTPTILEENEYLTLWLTATNTAFDIPASSVSVLIGLPAKVANTEQAFPEPLYGAVYNIDDNTVLLTTDIDVTVPDLTITIRNSEHSQHFHADANTENPLNILISVDPPLDPSVIETTEVITLVLMASTAETDYGSTVVVIDLPATECPPEPIENVFGKSLYGASYELTDPPTIEHEEPIVATTTEVLKIVIEPNEYPGIFGVDSTNLEDIKITVIDPLDPSVVEGNDYIKLVLVAKSEDETINYGSTIVLLDLPEGECPVVPADNVFGDTLYEGTYVLGTPPTVTFPAITATSGEPLTIAFVDNDYSKYFDVTFDVPPTVVITVRDPALPENIIAENDFITLELTAKNAAGTVTHGYTGLVIALPSDSTPGPPENVFGNTLYEGKYEVPETGPPTVEITRVITATSTEVLKISIVNNDYSQYFDVTFDVPPTVLITVRDPALPENIIAENDFITLELTATNEDGTITHGYTGLVIALPSDSTPGPPENVFGNTLYEGKYEVPETGPPTVEITRGITATSTEVLKISIVNNDYSQYFDVTFVAPPTVVITVRDPALPENIISENDFITLELTATNEDETVTYGYTGLVITLPSNDPPLSPENVFGESMYEGKYEASEGGAPTVEITGGITATSTEQLQIAIVDNDYSEYFAVSFDAPPTVLITVREPALPPSVIEANEFITLILNAKSIDGTVDYGSTGVVIDLPNVPAECPTDDVFGDSLFEGEYTVSADDEHGVVHAEISVIPDDIIVSLEGDHAANFKATLTDEKKVIITIETDLEEAIWIENRYIKLILIGRNDDVEGAATIVLALPMGECPSTPPPNPEVEITFTDISFSINPRPPGSGSIPIGDLVATVVPVTEVLEYGIQGQPTWVVLTGNRLSVQDGVMLSPGIYTFTAIATATPSAVSKQVKVTVYVLSHIEGEGKTSHSFIIKEIEEAKIQEIWPMHDFGVGEPVIWYTYEITQQEPPTDSPLFTIVPDTKMLTSVAIDLESAPFETMVVPQVTLTIVLKNLDEPRDVKAILARHPLFQYLPKAKLDMIERDFRQCVTIEQKEIIRDDKRMYIVIAITDVNDNSPVFENPPTVIGYPNRDIVFDINPSYLIQVKATDKDRTAEIRYSTTSTSLIRVNEQTGVVYPTEGLYSGVAEHSVVIVAHDGIDEHNANLNLKILLLDKDHISVLVFENTLLENLDDKLAELSTEITVTLWSLSAGSIPLKSAPGSTTRADTDSHLKVIVYGIENGAAITHEALKTKLIGKPVVITNYAPGTTTTDQDPSECNDTGLIAGISVLAVLLVVTIAGFITFYVMKKKNNASLDLEQLPEHKTSFKKSNASQNGYNNDVVLKDVATRRPTQYPMEKPEVDNSSISSNEGEDFDEARERRKSVTFNEKIQNFNIAKDNENEAVKPEDDKSM